MDSPDKEFLDTLCVSRRKFCHLPNHQLQTVAEACDFCMKNHHHALADAEACAWIAREIIEVMGSGGKKEMSAKIDSRQTFRDTIICCK